MRKLVTVNGVEIEKESSCKFFRKCKLTRSCDGCPNPVESQKYDDLYEYKTQYSADLEAEDGDFMRERMGWPSVVEKVVRHG